MLICTGNTNLVRPDDEGEIEGARTHLANANQLLKIIHYKDHVLTLENPLRQNVNGCRTILFI
jgi:hypothetical protein